ncbi:MULTISPECIES: hypothetical protein [unclassified Lebetimonas]|uniref:hypothetical protein n=2 Tax=unclassified Lebetimonas TaxID=2648158 RepID=UPI0012EC4D1C|nr:MULTISPECIES: hypothetical protein [unclassified Lebetimonas]
MMNRLEEFLQNLDKKNLLLLYLSVFIIGIIIYYNFNYNVLSSKIDENSRLIGDLENKANVSLKKYNTKLAKLKKEYRNLKIKEYSKLQDLDYLNKKIDLSILNINDKNFYSLLENILYKSSVLNLNPNFYISKNNNNFKIYNIEINGTLGYCNERNLFNLIKFLESQKYVNSVESCYIDENRSNFYIKYNVWGLK